MSDFVLISSLLYCWLSGGFALVLGPAGEKPKNSTVKKIKIKNKYKKKNIVVRNTLTRMVYWRDIKKYKK